MQINTSEKKYFLFSAHMQTLAKKKKKSMQTNINALKGFSKRFADQES